METTELANNCQNYIVDTVMRIDRLQKEAELLEQNSCITCESSLINYTNNTIPVSFVLCSGTTLCAKIGTCDNSTTFFRIESIRCKQYVTLRLLELNGGCLQATNHTLIFNLDCACAMYCQAAIQTEKCNA